MQPTKTQGQSLSTLDKERQIEAIFRVQFNIIRSKCPGSIYRHIDLNAGSGWNEEYDVPGSPLVFVELADEMLGHKWRAYFVEWDAGLFEQLRERLGEHPRVTLIHADNNTLLDIARKHISKWDLGSVLCDPNGWLYRRPDGAGCPVRELQEFFRRYQRMDLLVNLNAQTYIKMRGAAAAPSKPGWTAPTYRDFYGLGRYCEEFLRVFNKQHGHISTLSSNGHSRFFRLILRQKYFNDYKVWGWYHLNSPEAHSVYNALREEALDKRTIGEDDSPRQLSLL